MKRIVKRYLLFEGDSHEEIGGWGDFQEDYDTLEEARAAAIANKRPRDERGIPAQGWWHIVDTEVGDIVEAG